MGSPERTPSPPFTHTPAREPRVCLTLSGRMDAAGARVGVVLSGGNVDLDTLPGLLSTAGAGFRL